MNTSNTRPITQQKNLAKLPKALAPLIERPQWAVWRWTQKPDRSWQKPPFMALQPDRHASTSDPNTWADYWMALVWGERRKAAAAEEAPRGGNGFDSSGCRYSIDEI